MNGWTWALVVVLAAVWVAGLCLSRVRRLDRLHVRTDAARGGLESALERRAGAASVAAAVLDTAGLDTAGLGRPKIRGSGPDLRRLAVAAFRAADTGGADRETAENALGRQLAALDRSVLPPAVRDELMDAEQLLILARSVHNDAVRDTLGLRSRRLVRWLRLAGTAPLPEYFEIADAPAPCRPPIEHDRAGHGSETPVAPPS